MKKYLFIVIIILSVFEACSTSYPSPPKSEYKRIVVIGQSALNLLLELNLQERIVGIAYLEDINSLKKYDNLPILTTGWLDKETILSLKPDLIFAMEAALRVDRIGNREFWEKRGIKVFTMDDYRQDKSFVNYFKDIHSVGVLFDIQSRADSFIVDLQELRSKSAKQQLPHRRVLHLSHLSSNQFYYYPPSLCLLDEIIEDCGSEYINWGNKPFILPIETILESNPDKIIITQFRKKKNPGFINQLSKDRYLRHLPAVYNKNILEVNYTQSIRGTINMQEVYFEVAKFLQYE
ncbi:ABC transporter substrate-binding protein [uncultured Bacteroides sp.]|uniref:ABC transporter substrate-binding protein n=1 Tax=uncultured Bacteroides sp. TaxID=162156 RepID=UPI002AABAC17|nr:ABC transporter substrate-binding protein [uncultured Bacteroides sp.]